MTREEAITVLKGLYDNPLFSDVHKVAFNIAIHDIKAYHKWNLNELVLTQKDNEQETVSKESYDHEYFLRKEFEIKIAKLQRQLEEQAVKAESVIDKIRAEIQELPIQFTCAYEMQKWALEIIDKYKAESEEWVNFADDLMPIIDEAESEKT